MGLGGDYPSRHLANEKKVTVRALISRPAIQEELQILLASESKLKRSVSIQKEAPADDARISQGE
jgi:hypothetical protein